MSTEPDYGKIVFEGFPKQNPNRQWIHLYQWEKNEYNQAAQAVITAYREQHKVTAEDVALTQQRDSAVEDRRINEEHFNARLAEKDAEIAALKKQKEDIHDAWSKVLDDLQKKLAALKGRLDGIKLNKAIMQICGHPILTQDACNDVAALLSAPASPWRDYRNDPPKESDGRVLFLLHDDMIYHRMWNYRFSEGEDSVKGWQAAPPLPTPAVEQESAEDAAWKNHQMSESRPCNQRDFRAGFQAALLASRKEGQSHE